MDLLNRRINIILNYVMLVSILSFFQLLKCQNFTVWMIISMLASLILFVITFINSYKKTDVWRLIHKPSKDLDERENQFVLKVTRIAYAIFTIIAILIIYIQLLIKIDCINVINAAGLIYFAHILPCSIAAWSMKQV